MLYVNQGSDYFGQTRKNIEDNHCCLFNDYDWCRYITNSY